MKTWLLGKSDCQYKYGYDGTGIAVNTENKTIHMICHNGRKQTFEKYYSYNEVRSYCYETGIKRKINPYVIEEHTSFPCLIPGLKILVKDIECPCWFIKFKKTKTVEKEMIYWMEILNQLLE